MDNDLSADDSTQDATVFHTPWLRVRERKRTGSLPYYILDRANSVTIIPLSESKRTILLKQERLPIAAESWEFPMGQIEINELPLNAAKRELSEETGIVAEVLRRIASYYPVPALTPQLTTVFIAEISEKDLDQATCPQGEDDIKDLIIIPFSEVIAKIKDGNIQDALTIIAAAYVVLDEMPRQLRIDDKSQRKGR
jgi:ADP-ribose pyrophosphatase